MATLVCPVCRKTADGAFCPEHMEFLEPDEPTTAAGADPAAEGGTMAAEALAYVAAGPPAQPPPAAATRRDDVPAAFVLTFPFGPVPVTAERLRVGRSPEVGPLAGSLARYDNVSRHHAELWMQDGELRVMDLGSSNGTFLNDRRLPPYEAARLRDGDVIRFAADLSVPVRSAGGGR